jgi:hypothetical protein
MSLSYEAYFQQLNSLLERIKVRLHAQWLARDPVNLGSVLAHQISPRHDAQILQAAQ